MLHTFSPTDFGVPEKFASWRPYQPAAVERIVRSRHRFVPLCAPTGSGKTLTGVMAALVGEKRTVFLTSSKGLQDQTVADFSGCGLADIRGKANYKCRVYPGCSCDEAAPKCDAGTGCRHREAYDAACASPLLVTNYACWMHNQKAQRGAGRSAFCLNGKNGDGTPSVLNPIEMLVLDEAHNAEKELSSFLHTEIGVREVQEVTGEGLGFFEGVGEESPLKEWRDLAKERLKGLEGLVEEWQEEADEAGGLKRLRRLKGLVDRLGAVAGMPDKGWVVDKVQTRGAKHIQGYQFDPVWLAGHAEGALFCGIPKIVPMSATLTEKGLGLIGIRQGEYEFKEYPFIFDRKRCPIYWLPNICLTPASRVTESDKRSWVRLNDRIIEMRTDRKGIVLVPSFELQRYFLQHTEHRRLMLYNDTSWGAAEDLGTQAVLEKFRKASEPKVLVSPSVGTGYDFPGRDCEYLIIGKVPFPDMRSKVMQERKRRDPMYAAHTAMQTIEQWSGRGMRHDEDQCEVFVTDAGVGWFMRQYQRTLANSWFRMTRVDGAIPEPPERLRE